MNMLISFGSVKLDRVTDMQRWRNEQPPSNSTPFHSTHTHTHLFAAHTHTSPPRHSGRVPSTSTSPRPANRSSSRSFLQAVVKGCVFVSLLWRFVVRKAVPLLIQTACVAYPPIHRRISLQPRGRRSGPVLLRISHEGEAQRQTRRRTCGIFPEASTL